MRRNLLSLLASLFHRFSAATQGNVAIIFALSLPVLVGAAGLGVETTYWYYDSLRLQSAADAAAYAGELEKLSGSEATAIEAAAGNVAARNGFDSTAGSIVVNSPPAIGPNVKGNAVEVILTQSLPRFFTAIFSDQPVVVAARAVAKSELASKACILALDPTATRAALFSGNTNLKLTGCAVMSNSSADESLSVQGSATVEVACLIAVGGVHLGSGATMTDCASAITRTQSADDPFADLPAPDPTATCRSSKGATLQPGNYCTGLSLKGTVKLNSGVYIIGGGDLKINANAVVNGSGVMIYVRCGSRVAINGTATVTLGAATTGTYAGILFYGERDCEGYSHTFNGTAKSLLTGAIYFAHEDVNYLGNFSGSGGCSQVVAGTIQWSGNTSIKQDCTALGMRDIEANKKIRMVE